MRQLQKNFTNSVQHKFGNSKNETKTIPPFFRPQSQMSFLITSNEIENVLSVIEK
jgi:hypothetical protein